MLTRPLLLLLIFLVASFVLATLGVLGNESLPSADEAQLRRIQEHDWPKTYRQRDALLPGRILADEFVGVDAEGQASTKRGEWAYLKQSGRAAHESFENTLDRLRVHGRAALVAGTRRSRGRATKGSLHTV